MLLSKARNDARLLAKIVGDAEVSDEIVGFHAQQTVEKALKAVLESRGIDYPYTHDIGRLYELLGDSGDTPDGRDEALALTPWAVEFRYGDVVTGRLDRDRALAIAQRILGWADEEIRRHDDAPEANDS